ncbi:MAG: hypothetical protein V1887_00970 [Candidatus Aenigmatarchaeota archaeon]
MRGVLDPKIIVVMILVVAITLFSIGLATGVLDPLKELSSKSSLADILRAFGIIGGIK